MKSKSVVGKVCIGPRGPLPNPLDGILLFLRATPSIEFTGTHSCILVERGIVREKCVVQERHAMTRARSNPDPFTVQTVRPPCHPNSAKF